MKAYLGPPGKGEHKKRGCGVRTLKRARKREASERDADESANAVVERRSSDCQQGCQTAKFDPFLSLDCARVEGGGRNPRKGRDQILQRSVAEP